MTAQPSLFDMPLPRGWMFTRQPVHCRYEPCQHGRQRLKAAVDEGTTIEQCFHCDTCGHDGHTSTRKDLMR
jgi:hypothetical protein